MAIKGEILALAIFVIVISSTLASAAGDVAYIYRYKGKVDDNIVKLFNDSGLKVDLINEQNLPSNFNDYRFIFVGDETYRKYNRILVNDYPSIVASFYNADNWGLTDDEGVSQMGATHPLSVLINGGARQVYTEAMTQNRVAISYYYLDEQNKNPEMMQIASTETTASGYKIGDVISYAYPGIKMMNGKTQKAKLCFFGIVESDYWTPQARSLFQDCVNFVAAECSVDSDCPDDENGERFCIGKDIYQEIISYSCENGQLASCVPSNSSVFIESCPYDCLNGQCIGQCDSNEDCDDSNQNTEDICHNPGTPHSFCTNEPIACFSKSDCGTDGFVGSLVCSGKNITRNYVTYDCLFPGTANSSCQSTISVKTLEICPDECVNGVCVDINCSVDADCDDSNVRTEDKCVNPGTINSYCTNKPIACLNNAECGTDGFIGNLFCTGKNVTQEYKTFTCLNPGKASSSCTSTVQTKVKETCTDACVSGECVDIVCFFNSDCNDNNLSTQDICHNPGQVNSFCTNSPINCFNDADCGMNGFIGNLFCTGKNVTRSYISYHCNNPGISTSYCSSSTENLLVQECAKACVLGECKNIECYKNSDCDDLNPLTLDECINPGTISSECRNTPINCNSNNDCGFTGFVGSEYCSGNNIMKNYQTSLCNAPGTPSSSCNSQVNPKLVDLCQFACNNGLCIRCDENSDCDDHNPSTNDVCINPNTPQSRCSNEETEIECFTNSDCGITSNISQLFCSANKVNQLIRTWTCNNPGTHSSFCSSSILQQIIQICPDKCANGECVSIACYNNNDCNDNNSSTFDICNNPGTKDSFCTNNPIEVICSSDSDCGNDGFIGDKFCYGKNVSQLYQTFSCYNPGTKDSFCASTVTQKTKQVCTFVCSNAACLDIECFSDSDCDDSNASTQDICKNPGTPSSHCEHNPIGCFVNSDCGISGPLGNLFCVGNNVYQNYQSAVCYNAGQVNSYCNNSIAEQFKESCDYACILQGICIRCDEDSDCDDLNAGTTDICVNPGTINSYCNNSISCTNLCSLNDRRCDNNGYQVCGNYDSDICYEWSQVTECSIGETCVNGYCIPQTSCEDECDLGEKVCAESSSYKICGNFDSDNCLDWSNAISCPPSQICSDGNCITEPSCTSDCVYGSRECINNGYKVCGNFDSDSCYEWSLITQCGLGSSCSSGYCS
jgi:hypothetical protein